MTRQKHLSGIPVNRPDLAQTFRDTGRRRTLKLGETLFAKGSKGEALYLVTSGRLRVVIQDLDRVSKTVGALFPGDHCGEGSLLSGQPHRASVRAAEQSEVVEVSRKDFGRAIQRDETLKAYFEDQAAHIKHRDFTRFIRPGDGGLNPEGITEFFRNLERRFVPAGETIDLIEGRVYLIGSGKVKFGRSEDPGRLGPGECLYRLGSAGASDRGPAYAETDCVLYTLDRGAFRHSAELTPQIAEALAHSAVSELRERPPDGTNGQVQNGTRIRSSSDGGPTDMSSNGNIRTTRKFPFLHQHDESDCGAACLAMICKHYRMPIAIHRLRDLAGVSRQGATLAGVAEAAETVGFVTRGVRTSYKEAMRAQLPAIVHWEGHHYVVLYEISPQSVRIADPAVGLRKLTRKEFEDGWTNVALLLEYTDRVQDNEPSGTSFRRFLPFLKPHSRSLVEVLSASLLMSLFGLATPLFTQSIIDKVLVHHDRDLLHLMLIGMVVVALFQMATGALRTYLITYVSARLGLTMLSHFYRHLLSLPLRFFSLRRTGDLTTRFGENATVQGLLTGAVVSAILDVLMLFIYLSLMLYYNAELTLVAIAFIPLTAGLTLAYTPILRSISQRAFAARAEQSSVLIDSLRGIDVVKTMAIERDTRWRWENKYTKELKVGFQGMKAGLAFGSAGQLVSLFSSTFILYYGATLVIGGELSVGQLMAFNAMIGNVTRPVMGLIDLWPQVQEARIALDRLNDVYETPMEASRHGNYAVVTDRIEGRIGFENVFFRYGSGSEEPFILSEIDLAIEPGTVVAVVGRSGAGKTTLVKLISRLFDPTEGRVLIDGVDVRDYDPAWLRRQVGMVLQDTILFSGTIAENIAVGVDEIDMGRVHEVAHLASADTFIGDLAAGYETKIGEMGLGLSGGQRQRIAIARALYGDPRILVFDEATNALDTDSERAILENLDEILADRTAVIVAHRMSTVRNADLIVAMEKGRVMETGGHDDLLSRDGIYAHLLGQQLERA